MTSIPSVQTAAKEFDIRYYADLLWRGRIFVASAALVGMGLGALAAWLQVPAYQASAMVQIEPPTPNFMSVTDALMGGGGYWQNTDFYNTQFRILRSKSLGELAVDKLKLAGATPASTSMDKDGPDPERGSVFMSHVSIEPIAESRLVLIQATHTDPKQAALWANTLADVYIEQTLSNRVESAKKAYDWLQDRMAATQRSMLDAQQKLLESYKKEDLFVPEGSVSAVSTSIAKLNEEYIDASSRRIGLEAALKQVADMRHRGQSLDSVPQVAADTLISELNGQLSGLGLEMTRLKEKFKEAHPEVQKVQAQMDQIRKAKDARAAQIVDGLNAEFAQLQKRELQLKAAIDEQKKLGASQSLSIGKLETLKKEAESAKSLYEVLLQKLNETDIASSIRTNNVTLVESASVPLSPVRPDKKRIAGAGLLLGLLLGVALVLGRDYLDNTVKDPEEMERYLHLDLLAAVPRSEEANAHLVTEAYQNLRTALLFARKSEGGQVVLITSTAPQEGKTTTLVNLAKLLASSGEKTIVLDFDLRRAQLHGRLGLTREPGLTNFFAKHEAIDTLARPTRVPNLFALTAGPLPPNPPALLARKDLADFLDQLRRDYEWVLLDSPPLASVTDALLLARHADITVFVVQHNKIDKKLVKRNVGALRKATPHLLGAVLNGVDVKSKGYYYYYYHQEQPSQPGAAGQPSGSSGRKSGPQPVSAAKH